MKKKTTKNLFFTISKILYDFIVKALNGASIVLLVEANGVVEEL